MNIVKTLSVLIGILVVSASYSAADPVRLEAETGILTGTNIASSISGYSGDGYVAGFTDGDDRVELSFQASAGLYDLTIGFRTPSGEKGFNGALNGVGFSGMFPGPRGFEMFNHGAVLLKEGTNTLWLGGGWSYYEIDYFEFEEIEPPAPPLPVDATPVDPMVTDEARSLLELLAANYGMVTLSGQQDVVELGIVESLTGKTPAILGGDLIEYSPSRIANGSNPRNHTESLISAHGDGMIITLSWHWNAPTDLVDSSTEPWWRGFYTSGTTFNFAEALADPHGANYALLLNDIDTIAVELKKLQMANVPVLWRPLHESDGGWFWWGTQGSANLKALWVLLYTRLTDYHDIHNLIWVQTIEDLDWYAGDEYVDIVGVDYYPDDPGDPMTGSWGKFLERFDGRKIISLSEFGRVPDVPTMHQLGVVFSYFMSWNGDLGARGMPDVQKLSAIYNSLEVVTLDELANLGDQDGDGLTGLQETVYGSSDSDKDSNDDGVEDGAAVKLGYEPMNDLSPIVRFFETKRRWLKLRKMDTEESVSTPFEIDLSMAIPSTLSFQMATSPDLIDWVRYSLEFTQFVENEDGSVVVEMEVDDIDLFLRLVGVPVQP